MYHDPSPSHLRPRAGDVLPVQAVNGCNGGVCAHKAKFHLPVRYSEGFATIVAECTARVAFQEEGMKPYVSHHAPQTSRSSCPNGRCTGPEPFTFVKISLLTPSRSIPPVLMLPK